PNLGGRQPSFVWRYFERGEAANNNRYSATCKHCGDFWDQGRVAVLQTHILVKCNGIMPTMRAEAAKELTDVKQMPAPTMPQAKAVAGNKRKAVSNLPRATKQTPIATLLAPATPFPKVVNEQYITLLLRWIIMAGISFAAVDSPLFYAFVAAISNDSFKPVGSGQMRGEYLNREFAAVYNVQMREIKEADNCTFTFDGWSSIWKESIQAGNLIAPGPPRKTYTVSIHEMSTERHSGEAMAEYFIAEIEKVGTKRVAALCTNGASAMNTARRIVTERQGFKHIIEMRCMIHGFALILGSTLGHAFAKELVALAQCIVTFFNASSLGHGFLFAAARAAGVSTGLTTSNTTRFTSVHIMLVSVFENRVPLQIVWKEHPELF
ncbi:unnamed protein product, partial [Phaeothamnion confervicola]